MQHFTKVLKMTLLYQEIGTIEAAEGHELDLSLFPAGAMLFLLPFHSCAAAACYPVRNWRI